ncbi:hypothetical protein B296_00002477 [Ensete ventricosum]|uniref:Uncharacterized protein n=1 Tax=Ensete ventricosum TaxID=4639 RepID=A0A427B561_ENSVE|nr:hypothetical protein B296_00002477 [Ensete ventricosum]
MAFRGREIYKKIARKVGGSVPPEVMDSVKKLVPNNKIVMGRAKRGIFAGRHIQFGNKVSEDGGNNYIHDRHIRIKVTTHALRCIDKAGGIDEYLLKTPYHKMGTELGLVWKARIEKMYEELGKMEVGFFSPEEEAKIEKGFAEFEAAKKSARREARKAMAKQRQMEGGASGDQIPNAPQIREGTTEDSTQDEHQNS